jgi:hypothetical protein
MLNTLATRVTVLDEDFDLKKQLLFCDLGSVKLEKEVNCATPDGNEPVSVIDGCPV